MPFQPPVYQPPPPLVADAVVQADEVLEDPDVVLEGLAPLFREPRRWMRPRVEVVPEVDPLEDLQGLFREPRHWRRCLRLPRRRMLNVIRWGPVNVIPDIDDPEELVEVVNPHRGYWRRIKDCIRRRRRNKTVGTMPDGLHADVGCDATNAPGEGITLPACRAKTKVVPRWKECDIRREESNRKRCFAFRVHDEDLYWHLKMHAFFLPRSEALAQQLRMRAIRYLEKQDCHHNVREHATLIAFVVTQAMMITPMEKRLLSHQERYFRVRRALELPLSVGHMT